MGRVGLGQVGEVFPVGGREADEWAFFFNLIP